MRVSKWTAAADDQCPLFVRHWQRPERPTALCATQLKPSWSWASSCHPLTGNPPFPPFAPADLLQAVTVMRNCAKLLLNLPVTQCLANTVIRIVCWLPFPPSSSPLLPLPCQHYYFAFWQLKCFVCGLITLSVIAPHSHSHSPSVALKRITGFHNARRAIRN